MRCVCVRGAQHVRSGFTFQRLMQLSLVELGSTPVCGEPWWSTITNHGRQYMVWQYM